MDKQEMLEKIQHVQNTDVEYEIFIHQRPPEEFGDAVKLYFNEDKTFKAVVFDPDTKEVFSEEVLEDSDRTVAFILKALEPKKDGHKELDYIDLDQTEPQGKLGDSWTDESVLTPQGSS